MTDAQQDSTPSPNVNQEAGQSELQDGGKQLTLIVYILYFVGFATGITAVAGVIIAHMNVARASETYRTHFDFQLRTFWMGLATVVVGTLLSFFLIGYLVLLWFAVWTAVRCIKGVMRLSEDQPIENPATLLW